MLSLPALGGSNNGVDEMSRVLCIEDQPDLLSVIEEALEEVGYEVEGAVTSEDGLAAFDEFQPDLVICDRDTIDQASADVLRAAIVQAGHGADVPVIVLTGSEYDEVIFGDTALPLSGPLDVDELLVAATGLINGELPIDGGHSE